MQGLGGGGFRLFPIAAVVVHACEVGVRVRIIWIEAEGVLGGREGVAITLAEPRERRGLENIERLTKQKFEIAKVPTVADLRIRQIEMTVTVEIGGDDRPGVRIHRIAARRGEAAGPVVGQHGGHDLAVAGDSGGDADVGHCT